MKKTIEEIALAEALFQREKRKESEKLIKSRIGVIVNLEEKEACLEENTTPTDISVDEANLANSDCAPDSDCDPEKPPENDQ